MTTPAITGTHRTTTDTATTRDAALRSDRRDLLAAHRTLLDYGITTQTAEVHDRLVEVDLDIHDLTAHRRHIHPQALP